MSLESNGYDLVKGTCETCKFATNDGSYENLYCKHRDNIEVLRDKPKVDLSIVIPSWFAVSDNIEEHRYKPKVDSIGTCKLYEHDWGF